MSRAYIYVYLSDRECSGNNDSDDRDFLILEISFYCNVIT